MLKCTEFLKVLHTLGDALNSPLEATEILGQTSKALVQHLQLKGCEFYLLSRDQRVLEPVAHDGLSDEFMSNGHLEVERTVAEVLKGRTISVADCTTDPRIQHSLAFHQEGIRSLLMLPLKTRGQVIGLMRLLTSEERTFCDEEMEILDLIADLSTSILLHAMFLKILHDVSETVRSSLDVDDVLKQIVRVITEDLRAKGSMIRLLDPDTNRLQLRAAYGLSDAYLHKGPVDADKSLAETLTGKCVTVYDAGRDARLQYPEAARREGIASVLAVPLMIHGHVIGVLRVYTHKPYEFSDDEIYLMTMVGEQCALVIRNAQLYSGLKERYETLVTDFHNWFDRFYGPGGAGMEADRV
ncbi:MAG: GAF domain-containing protein [Acidobacteriota bacterium]